MTGFANHPNSANLASQVAGDPIELERKLRTLIAMAEGVVARLEIYYDDTDRVRFERDRLRAAIAEAKP
jgi:hypothetical protein